MMEKEEEKKVTEKKIPFDLHLVQVAECKYGENAYQAPAGLFSSGSDDPLSLDKFVLVAGTAMSYNNYCDLDRLLQTMTHIAATFDINSHLIPRVSPNASKQFIALGAKHGNVCGAGVSLTSTADAIKKMVTGDLQALFGGLVMLNFPVDVEEAELLLTYEAKPRRLLDGIIAPEFSPEAIALLSRKGDKCRFIANPLLLGLDRNSLDTAQIFRYTRGSALVQPNYTYILDLEDKDLKRYGYRIFRGITDLLLAKAICDTSNSNTITIVKNGQLIGNGVGQQSRVGGAELALSIAEKNGHNISGSVAASDSFFPFTDGPQVLIDKDVKVIISTSGSVNDNKVIELCESSDVVLYLVPDKKGRGFYNH